MAHKIEWALVLAAATLVVFAGLWWGWRSRVRRQSGLARPAEVPAELEGRESSFACPVQYVSTTMAGDWLDRVAAHGLGAKGRATALVFPEGLVLARDGAADLWVPAASIQVLRRESGMAGKFVEKDGLVVLSWRLGQDLVDTGVRTRLGADTAALLHALQGIAPQAADRLPTPGPERVPETAS